MGKVSLRDAVLIFVIIVLLVLAMMVNNAMNEESSTTTTTTPEATQTETTYEPTTEGFVGGLRPYFSYSKGMSVGLEIAPNLYLDVMGDGGLDFGW